MSKLWHNVRFSLRMLGKNPGFTAVAVALSEFRPVGVGLVENQRTQEPCFRRRLFGLEAPEYDIPRRGCLEWRDLQPVGLRPS